MGGQKQIEFSLQGPDLKELDRLTRLVIACSTAQGGNHAVWNERIALIEAKGMGAVVPGVLDRWFTPEFRAEWPGVVERIGGMLRAAPPKGYAASAAGILDGVLMRYQAENLAWSAHFLAGLGLRFTVRQPAELRGQLTILSGNAQLLHRRLSARNFFAASEMDTKSSAAAFGQ